MHFKPEKLEQFWFEEIEKAKTDILAGEREPPRGVALPQTFYAGTWEDIVVENYLAEHLLTRFLRQSVLDAALAKADLEHVLGFHEGSPEHLTAKGQLARYRTYGDLITFFHGYLGNDDPVSALAIIPRCATDKPQGVVDNARYYYEAAGNLARRIHAGYDPWERLAEVLPAYVVILRGLPH